MADDPQTLIAMALRELVDGQRETATLLRGLVSDVAQLQARVSGLEQRVVDLAQQVPPGPPEHRQ